MVSQKNKKQGSRRKQQGGDGNHNIQSVGFPIQWFNPGAQVPAYYPAGNEMLTKQYQSAYGPINAVNTTQPNACGTEMGPNLAPFSPYEDLSGIMTGGSQQQQQQQQQSFQQIVNPLTGRKVSIRSRLGQQILQQYLQQL
jgi:hypothetical protein